MVIRQNRAVPILMVLTIAWVLYLAGCFGTEATTTAQEETPTPVAPTPTASPVVSPSAEAGPAEEPYIYTVEEGDLLPTIAAKHNVTTAVILRANPGLNPNVLVVGQQLRIPEATTDNTAIQNPDAEREAGESVDYVVQPGDSMGAIATEYVVSLDALQQANPDADPSALQIGQVLVIPPYGTGLSPEALAARSTPVPVDRAPGEVLEHVVAPGDLITALADLYGVTVAEIIEFNGLEDGNNILVGQQLLIPPPSVAADP